MLQGIGNEVARKAEAFLLAASATWITGPSIDVDMSLKEDMYIHAIVRITETGNTVVEILCR